MPRQHIYLSQRTLDGIKQLVEERRAEGATSSEVNMSSMSAELLEIGLRVKAQAKLKNDENENSKEEFYRQQFFEEVIKSRMILQDILKLLFSLDEIKTDNRNVYSETINRLKLDVINRMEMLFPTEQEQAK